MAQATKPARKRKPVKAAHIKRKAGRMPIRARKKPGNAKWYVDFGDLLKLKDTNHMGGLLQTSAVSVLHGDAGTGKTFAALAMAGCVAYGLPILEGGPRCRRGLVIYVAYEDIRGFKARRLAWLRQHQLPALNLSVDALKMVNPYDQAIDDLPGIGFDLLDPAKVEKFLGHAEALSRHARLPVRFIVIDVLREGCGGIESTKTFRLAGGHAQKIATHLGSHVMLLHHNTKNSERMRGPANLEGIIQQRFLLRRQGRNCQLEVMKNRESAGGAVIPVRISQVFTALRKGKAPVHSLAFSFDPPSSEPLLEANAEKVLELCDVFDPDSSMTEGKLLKASGMSLDGRGGMQRRMLRKWIPPVPRGIVVHNGGQDYRRFARELIRGRWVYYCQAIDPATGKEELLQAKTSGPKHEPEVQRKRDADERKHG